jgi:hypothetical protein
VPEDPKTQELRVAQTAREQEERTAEHEAVIPDEAEQHARRADKAAYLKDKLEQRARSERDASD